MARRVWLVAGIALLSANLRPAVVAVSPLVPTIRADTGFSSATAGLLTTVPVLCFGALAPLAPRLSRRFGSEVALGASLAVLTLAVLIRSAPASFALLAGTVLVGAAITMGNVLLPGVVKRDFPDRIGPMMGLYSTGVVGGAALAAGLTVPLMDATGWGWRATLALWALWGVAGVIAWSPQVGLRDRTREPDADRPSVRRLYGDRLAWQVSLFMGLQSLLFYATAAWLPTLLTDHGMSDRTAGWLLSLMSVTGMITTFSVPVLAGRRPTQYRLVMLTAALFAVSLTGLLAAPVGGAVAWALLFGLAQGAGLGLALTLIVLRSHDAGHAAELSGMAQTIGYLIAAVGPLGVGALHDASGGWTVPLAALLVVIVPLVAAGLGAARDRHVLAPVP